MCVLFNLVVYMCKQSHAINQDIQNFKCDHYTAMECAQITLYNKNLLQEEDAIMVTFHIIIIVWTLTFICLGHA